MKVLILAGGYATRLWPITKERAKPLLPLAGKPILDNILDEIEQIDEVDKAYVATNERFEDSFDEYLDQREEDIYELVIESQEAEDEKYGAVGGIINVIEKKESDDYLVIGGDNYYSFDISDFIDFAKEKDSIANACYKVEDLEEAKNYGIVGFDDDQKVTDFQEKPENPKSRMASTACYFYPEEKLSVFDEYVEYWDGRIPEEQYLDEPGRFLQWSVEEYEVYAYSFEGEWVDIGTRAGYLRAEREIREGNIIEGEVEDSDIGENVTILPGAEVVDSEIENSIIFGGCEIEDSIIQDSIVGDDTEIESKDLRKGLIKEMD